MTNETPAEQVVPTDAELIARYKRLPQLLQIPAEVRGRLVRSGCREDILAHLIWHAAMEEYGHGDPAAAEPWKNAVQAMRDAPAISKLVLPAGYGVEIEHVYVVCDADTHNSAACRVCAPRAR